MNNKIIEKLEIALNNNELREYLKGSGMYRIVSREGSFSDLSAALYSGIYEYYKLYPEKGINILFEKEIIHMLDGNSFEIMCAFEYCWRQIICEERKTAPFKLSNQCILNIKKSMIENKDILSAYKEYAEFGGHLESGAYQYVQNIDKMIESEYGRKIL